MRSDGRGHAHPGAPESLVPSDHPAHHGGAEAQVAGTRGPSSSWRWRLGRDTAQRQQAALAPATHAPPPLTYGGGECHARPRMAVGLREEHRKLVREWNRFADDYNSVVAPRNLGRPLAASDDQMAEVRKLRKGGASLRRIAAETSVRRS